jgi:CRP-like cAMP-binding protein
MSGSTAQASRAETADANGEVAFLRAVPLFDGVADSELALLAKLFKYATYAAGDLILEFGTPSTELVMVSEGRVQVFVEKNGEKITLTTLGRGAYFGEMAIFDQYPRSANVAAVTAVKTCSLDREQFLSFLANHPSLLFQMCKVFTHRLRNTNSLLTKR